MVRRFAPRFAVERSNEGNARTGEGEAFVDGMGFNPVPRSPVKKEGVELQGDEVKEKVLSWPKDNTRQLSGEERTAW
jgi:hypothetical protein